MTNAIPFNETPAERSARWNAEYLAAKAEHRRNNITDTTHFHEKLTVAELIRVLQTLDQNAVVEVYDRDGKRDTVANTDIIQQDFEALHYQCGTLKSPAYHAVLIGY